MRFLLATFLFLFFSLGTSAQVLRVRDAKSNVGLEMATLFHKENKLMVFTNAKGEVDIKAFQGLEQIEIKLFGYKSILTSFEKLREKEFIISLEPSFIQLQQAVVTASKWSQSRQEIPAKITSITTEARQLWNPQTAADLLGISGEVFIQKSQQGGGSPMIRGFATNRLLYTVDGVRMNTAIFRSGNLQNVISLDPFAMEKTEVFFGPGSIIYGSDAIGAVMGFQTLQARFAEEKDFDIHGQVNLRGNTANNEKTGHLHLQYGGKKWAGVSSFSRFDYGDQRMGKRGPEQFLRPKFVVRENGGDFLVNNPDPLTQTPSGYEQYNLMQKVRFAPNTRWDFQYAFHYSETSPYARYDRLIRFRPNGQPRSAEWNYGPQIWMMNHLKAIHSKERGLYDKMSINLAYQKFEESRIDRNFNDPIRRTRTEKVDAWSFNLDFTKQLDAQGKLFYGWESIYNRVKSTGLDTNILTQSSALGPSRYPQSDWSSHALYTTYQRKINPKSMVQGGLRYNLFRLNTDFSNNQPFYPLPFSSTQNNYRGLIGSMGWVYHPTDSWSMHFTGSTGLRAPNVDDIGKFFDSEPGTVMVPNTDLKAEYAYNLELNVNKIVSDRLSLDLTGYFTYLDRALVRRPFQLSGRDSILYDGNMSRVFALQNAAFVRILGLQANLEWKINSQWTFTSTLNIQQGREEMDDRSSSPSRHAPPTYGLSRLNYKKNKWQLSFHSQYSAGFSFERLPLEERGKPELYASDENGNPYSPSWTIWGISSQYDLKTWLALNCGLENLGNIRYRPYSSGIAGPGRNFFFSINARF